jgi:hypothetical protein
MLEDSTLLTTGQFSSSTGLSVSVIRRLLRDGRIEGAKISGKWMIPESQLQSAAVRDKQSAGTGVRPKGSPIPAPSEPTVRQGSYPVSKFAEMTYLTEFGVIQWLKDGRLKGTRDAQGGWEVDSESLEMPHVKRMLR